jgi:hypothetical protein
LLPGKDETAEKRLDLLYIHSCYIHSCRDRDKPYPLMLDTHKGCPYRIMDTRKGCPYDVCKESNIRSGVATKLLQRRQKPPGKE